MIDELREFAEHLERYRAVTLQTLDMVDDSELSWRPHSDMMSLGQQFVHIAQGEDFLVHALFYGERDEARVRLPKQVDSTDEVRAFFEEVRTRTRASLEEIEATGLSFLVGDPPATRLSRLWGLVEHEVHHKAQIALYLRLLGKVPPFFNEVLEPGSRPDVEYREKLGGV